MLEAKWLVIQPGEDGDDRLTQSVLWWQASKLRISDVLVQAIVH